MKESEKDKVISTSMEIIMYSGDGRLFIVEALDAIANHNFSMAKEKLTKAQEKLTKAHCLQTDMIQGDIRGGDEKMEYSILFTHAQDTLMTVNSEFNIAKQMIKIFEGYEARISILEEKMKG